MFVMLAKKELVGHAGNVIADDDVARLQLRKFFIGSGHRAGSCQEMGEELFETLYRAVAVLGDGGMVVDVSEKEALELTISLSRSFVEVGEPFCGPANVVRGSGSVGPTPPFPSLH